MNNNIINNGIQRKFTRDNLYYKIDDSGYPSLSEYIVSHLYKYSNVKDYVLYDIEEVNIGGVKKIACKSQNFLNNGEMVITLQELHKGKRKIAIEDAIVKIPDIHEKIRYVVDFVESETNINDFGKYLTMLLEIDKFFYNDDRHFDNISVIKKNNGEYRKSPVYDNGAMLLSATKVYRIEDSPIINFKKLFSLPFSINFNEQVNAAIDLYGKAFVINYSNEVIDTLLSKVEHYYDLNVINRVKSILYDSIKD